MKKIKKALAVTLTALSFAGNVNARGKNEIQNTQVVDTKSQSYSNRKNKILNFLKNNKGKIIGITATAAVLSTIYGLGREGIYNGLFPASNKSLYYRNYTDADIDSKEQKALDKGLKKVELNTNFGTLRGFAHFPENLSEINKIVLVFSGNGGLACDSVNDALNGGDDKKNTVFVCFDYPTYGKSEGPTLSQKVLKKYAEECLKYAKNLKEKNGYKNARIATYGFSLGGFSASYLSKDKSVEEVRLWSPINWDSAVQGLFGPRWLGVVVRYLMLGGANFDSIENIKNSHKNCKIKLFSGSCAAGDFLSSEINVLNDEKYDKQIDKKQLQKYLQDIKELQREIFKKPGPDVKINPDHQKIAELILNQEKQEKEDLEKIINAKYKDINKLEEIVAKEVYRKLSKEGKKNNLGDRLDVSFLLEADHCVKSFDNSVWSLKGTWDKSKEDADKSTSKNV